MIKDLQKKKRKLITRVDVGRGWIQKLVQFFVYPQRGAYLLPLWFLPSLWIFQRLFMHRPFAAAFEIDYTTIFTTYNFDITRFHIYQICGLPWRRKLCQNRKLSKEIYICMYKKKKGKGKKTRVWTEFVKKYWKHVLNF